MPCKKVKGVADNCFVEKIAEIVGRNICYAKRVKPMIKEEGIYLAC